MSNETTKTPAPVEAKPAKKKVPVIRCNRDDINRLFGLFAAQAEFEKCANQMEHRFRAVPGGWRDLKMLISVLDSLVDRVLMTVPVDKLAGIRRMIPGMLYKTYYARPASVEKDQTLILNEQLDILCDYAHEQCKLCDRKSCGGCKLGKVFDSILTYDRDGRTWATIDIEGQ